MPRELIVQRQTSHFPMLWASPIFSDPSMGDTHAPTAPICKETKSAQFLNACNGFVGVGSLDGDLPIPGLITAECSSLGRNADGRGGRQPHMRIA